MFGTKIRDIMNIIHILSSTQASRYLNTRYLYHEEAKKGHRVDIIKWTAKKKTEILVVNNNLKVHFLPGKKIPLFQSGTDSFIPHLTAYIKALSADVIHAHVLLKLTTFSSAVACMKIRIPLIVSIHGVITPGSYPLEVGQLLYYFTLGRAICNIASKVRCLTISDAMEMINFGCSPNKIAVIPNGVDVEKFKPYGEVMDELIFWGGRFIPAKGLKYLIKALYFIVKKNPTVKLMMAGDGPLFSRINDMVRHLRIEKNVIFKGWVSHNEMSHLINAASVYAIPSLGEGMPYMLLEAMACGKAVVGSDIHGINDIITHNVNGILVPPQNPKALADAIMLLMEDKKLRRKLGQNARRLIIEKYDWNIISEKMEKIYCDAINQNTK